MPRDDVSVKTPGDRALDLLERLYDGGQWFTSAIELEQHDDNRINGEIAETEALEILQSAGRDGHGQIGPLVDHPPGSVASELAAFLERWPDAEYGPAHVVLSDGNFECIQWCQGILYAVQEARKLGGCRLYEEHSDNELVATALFLNWLLMGQGEMVVSVDTQRRAASVTTTGWRDIEADA